MKFRAAGAVVAAVVALSAGPAVAAAPNKAADAPTKPAATAKCGEAPDAKTGRLKIGNEKVTDLGCLEVDGKQHKPSVMIVMGRAAIAYFGIRLERNFTREIVESVRSVPF